MVNVKYRNPWSPRDPRIIDRKTINVEIFGTPGEGKSWVAALIAKTLESHGISVELTTSDITPEEWNSRYNNREFFENVRLALHERGTHVSIDETQLRISLKDNKK